MWKLAMRERSFRGTIGAILATLARRFHWGPVSRLVPTRRDGVRHFTPPRRTHATRIARPDHSGLSPYLSAAALRRRRALLRRRDQAAGGYWPANAGYYGLWWRAAPGYGH